MADPHRASDDPDDDVAIGRIGQGLERLVALSDGVIAIALTLLALELPVPKGDTDAEIWRDFVSHLDAEYISFVLSFVVIAAFWYGHHQLFIFVARLGPGIISRNFAFLFLIVTMPFATSLLDDSDSLLGTVLYATVVAGIGVVRMELVRHCRHIGVLRREADGPAGLRRGPIYIPTIAFGLSIPVAFISTSAARTSWLTTTVVAILTARLWRRRRRSDLGRPTTP